MFEKEEYLLIHDVVVGWTGFFRACAIRVGKNSTANTQHYKIHFGGS